MEVPMSDAIAQIHTDGAARGNPGPAAWAFVISIPGRAPIESAATMGAATNNVAEYTALIRALEHALTLGLQRVAVFSDSELMVKQINGEYSVKNPDMQRLHAEAQALRSRFASATLEHVRRAENARADALCNAALDGRSPDQKPASRKTKKKAVRSPRREDVDAAAIDCLRSAAQAWSDSSGRTPPPELIWDQLWSILEEAGALKRASPRAS
jgi:ribonuclease HI